MKIKIGKYPSSLKKDKKQKIEVRIDDHDIWNMDYTLAQIIHPMLIKLRKRKAGAPGVDDEDVPETLRSTYAPPKENDWDTDAFWFDRWYWVLDEMIWVFDQIKNNTPDEPYDTQSPDWHWRHVMYENRLTRGCTLFGKYFRGMWT